MDFSVLLSDIPTLLLVILGVPAVLAAYIVGGEYLVRRLPDKNRPQVRPWIWVGPALIIVFAFLGAPATGTSTQRFQDTHGNFGVLSNYATPFPDFPPRCAWLALRRNTPYRL